MDYSILHALLPRYLRRVGESTDRAPPTDSNAEQLHWLSNFVCVPGYAQLNGVEQCKNSGYYPMDVSSYLPILILNIPTDRPVAILDLCCCPGSKLLSLAEAAHCDSTVVGVDIAPQRLNICRSLMMSWCKPNEQFSNASTARKLIFRCDGTQFGPEQQGELIYDSCIIDEEITKFGGIKKRNKSYRAREAKRLKSTQSELVGASTDEETRGRAFRYGEFDFVLVDAECTHDASYRHMKYIGASPGDSEPCTAEAESTAESAVPISAFTKPGAALSHDSAYHGGHTVQTTASPQLTELQRGLILNGFRRLRPGGCLVYSTCSRDPTQNEEVVRWLLQTAGAEAELLHVPIILRNGCNVTTHTGAAADTLEAAGRRGTPALDFLNQDLPALMDAVRASYPSAEQQQRLAEEICREVSTLSAPRFDESALLPGTVSVDYRGGMSGHFIAKVRKVPAVVQDGSSEAHI